MYSMLAPEDRLSEKKRIVLGFLLFSGQKRTDLVRHGPCDYYYKREWQKCGEVGELRELLGPRLGPRNSSSISTFRTI